MVPRFCVQMLSLNLIYKLFAFTPVNFKSRTMMLPGFVIVRDQRIFDNAKTLSE